MARCRHEVLQRIEKAPVLRALALFKRQPRLIRLDQGRRSVEDVVYDVNAHFDVFQRHSSRYHIPKATVSLLY